MNQSQTIHLQYLELVQIHQYYILALKIFREEYQTNEGEATRKKEFQFVSAWEYVGEPKNAILHKEELKYKNIEVKERSYK